VETAVAISFMFMWKLPSLVNRSVRALSLPIHAPIAAPIPKPIAPRPPLVTNVRGFLNW
jgi:hypothetical protein